jgi:hypothetical protein
MKECKPTGVSLQSKRTYTFQNSGSLNFCDGCIFKPIWDIYLAKVNMATIDYPRGKRTEALLTLGTEDLFRIVLLLGYFS